MDFFEAQDQARRRTKWLVLWFLFSVVGVVIAVDTLIFFTLGQGAGGEIVSVLLVSSAATAGLILAASGFKSMQLSSGGAVVAKDLGGRLLMPGTTNFEEKKLLNIVEEMAIASGMPVPQVYLMDDEEGINAFAAGTEPSNTVIGVTRGTLQRLSREELEGVVAHEFSHILNGDMRLNMRIIGLVFGLVVISIVGRGMLEMLRFQRFGRRRDKEGGGLMLALLALGIGLMIIGSIGVFFGRMIQAGISRQREFLADASAVQFTRNPDGIAGALKKIGGLSMGGKLKTAKASEASHMMFSDAGLFSFGLATHPPLDVRIKMVQTSWDGEFTESSLPPVAEGHVKKSKKRTGPLSIPGVSSLSAFEEIGQESRRNASVGRQIREGLIGQWEEAVHGRDEAQVLIFGLLLAEDRELRNGEESYLRKTAGEEATELALGWQDEGAKLHSARKIALIDLALPALRGMSQLEYERFIGITRWLIASDGKVDLFEFMIQRVVERHLESHFERTGFGRIRYTKISQLAREAHLLVSTMAGLGAGNLKEREVAYRLAAGELGLREKNLAEPTSLKELGEVLGRFDEASPIVKKDLLIACGRAAAADGDLTSREVELLRSIADSIGCPIPPFVETLEETEN
ncbi:M48 family metallopeptidase [Akkermansiaceae bacterium]|nr:M48 family metallopeptidase [Akkermansiaceae bacterium]MDB4541537.1 M48 family metallopeptidase [Akkermansiaceae bacterium]